MWSLYLIMPFKKFTPKTSSIRFKVIINKHFLKLNKFKKLFFKKKKNNSGRNNSGQITVRHKGSGKFNFKRKIDIFREYNCPGNFINYDLDKKHTGFLSLIKYINGSFSYILAPNELIFNQSIGVNFINIGKSIGNACPIGWLKNGVVIYNLENNPRCGTKYIKSAGTFGKIIHHTKNNVLIKLPSKNLKYFSKYCFASIGRVSNILHFMSVLGKAGASRLKNIRPTVRGETMNPIDHPMGGRTRGGKPTKNPWGKIVK